MNLTYREGWIDNLKGIGIIFIIFGHSISCPDLLIDYFFSFHVPLFFFIAGINFKSVLIEDFVLFLEKRARRLLVPYVFFNLVSYGFWLLRVKVFDAPQDVPILRPLLGILYGNGHNKWLIHNEPLWFFICLFMTQILLFLILKFSKEKKHTILMLCLFTLIGYIDAKYLKFRLPWGIDVAITAVVFSGLGYLLKGHLNIFKRFYHPLLLTVVLLINFLISYFNGKIDMNYNKFNNIFLFYIGAFLGIFFWTSVSMKFGSSKILKYIGNNSLTILCLHIPILLVIVKLFMILNIPYSVQENNIAFMLIHTILTIVFIMPINYLLNRFMPFFIGVKK
ncbi:MAG: acyltransferase family protein [Candidatus Aenigmatarchaeota archaeon]